MKSRIHVLTGLLLGFSLLGSQASTEASAQAGEVAWYRFVNQGRSAGTMPRWRRVDQGAAATFPFLDNFEVNIRPAGEMIHATVRDGQSQFVTSISCTRANAPRRAAFVTNRIGDDQPVISVALQCSATEPPAR